MRHFLYYLTPIKINFMLRCSSKQSIDALHAVLNWEMNGDR